MGTSYTIVAIPAEDDYVWRISSEKVPHMTLLFLGDSVNDPNRIVDYLQHAAETSLTRFGMDVDHRGTLGPQDADVLFFGKYSAKLPDDFRSALLANDDIKLAYNSTEQYPEWIPHLTLGYPSTPAKKDDRDYPGISWVNFDRVALWTDNYEGPEFQLNSYNDLAEVSMSTARGEDFALKHFGVKGMHWGQRKASTEDSSSEDAKRVAGSKKTAKSIGTKALTTKELQDLVTRMNLEQQYSTLLAKEPSRLAKGQNAIKTIIGVAKTGQEIYNLVNSPAGKAGRKIIEEALKAKTKS